MTIWLCGKYLALRCQYKYLKIITSLIFGLIYTSLQILLPKGVCGAQTTD